MTASSAARIEDAERVLTAPALAFVEDLTRRFRPGIDELLARRRAVQERYNNGARPDFLAETADVASRRLEGRRRFPPTSRTGASRSPARSIAR